MDEVFEITAKEVTIQEEMNAREWNTAGRFQSIITRMRMF